MKTFLEYINESLAKSTIVNVDPEHFTHIIKTLDKDTFELRKATKSEIKNPCVLCKEYLCWKHDGSNVNSKDYYDHKKHVENITNLQDSTDELQRRNIRRDITRTIKEANKIIQKMCNDNKDKEKIETQINKFQQSLEHLDTIKANIKLYNKLMKTVKKYRKELFREFDITDKRAIYYGSLLKDDKKEINNDEDDNKEEENNDNNEYGDDGGE